MCTLPSFSQLRASSLEARGLGRDDLHAVKLLDAREQSGSRITAREHQPFLRRIFFGEDRQFARPVLRPARFTIPSASGMK
jgi:hypothetical protein